MSRSLSIVMVAMVTVVIADDSIAVYPPVQEPSAPSTVPYQHAQALDSYTVDAQLEGHEAGSPFVLASEAASPATSSCILESTSECSSCASHQNMYCTSAGARARASKMPLQPVKLYYLPPSPPCRAVMMTARAIGLELDLKLTNIMNGEHMTPEYLKMNPQHTIPTMDDGGFILWESRAIIAYLVNAYAKDDALYPKNPRQRALVDARLNFDLGTLYARYLDLYLPVIFKGEALNEDKIKKLDEALGFLELMLSGRAYVAGDNLTIADISIIVTLTNLNALKYNLEPYPQVNAWFERTKLALEPFGYTEIDHAGGQVFASMVNKN